MERIYTLSSVQNIFLDNFFDENEAKVIQM